MCKGYGSHFVCECVCICYHASYYIHVHVPRLYVENKVPLNFLWRVVDMYCIDFFEYASFESYAYLLTTSAFFAIDQLSMDKRDSHGFSSRRLVCRTSDSPSNLTDSSLITVNLQKRFLACNTQCVAKLPIRHMPHATCHMPHAWPYMVTLHIM